MVRFFIGTVFDVLEDQSITFNITDWADDIGSPPPSATPATRLSRYPQEGDEVLIIQPDAKFEIFLYLITPDDNFDVSLDYGPAYIRIRDANRDSDQNPDYYIEMNTSTGETLTMHDDLVELRVQDNSVIQVTGDTITGSTANCNFNLTSDTLSLSGNGATIKASKNNISINSGATIEMNSSQVTINGHLRVSR